MTSTSVLSTTTTALAAGAIALTVAVAPAPAATRPAPQLERVALVTAPEVGKGTVAVLFRTDRALPRKAAGGGLAAAARLGGRVASVGTLAKGRPCYVAYVKAPSLGAGDRAPVALTWSGRTAKRTLAVRRGGTSAAAGIGC